MTIPARIKLRLGDPFRRLLAESRWPKIQSLQKAQQLVVTPGDSHPWVRKFRNGLKRRPKKQRLKRPNHPKLHRPVPKRNLNRSQNPRAQPHVELLGTGPREHLDQNRRSLRHQRLNRQKPKHLKPKSPRLLSRELRKTSSPNRLKGKRSQGRRSPSLQRRNRALI